MLSSSQRCPLLPALKQKSGDHTVLSWGAYGGKKNEVKATRDFYARCFGV